MPLPVVQIVGNLTMDPELRMTKSQKQVASLRVACSDRKRTESGDWVDGETLYINVTAWNATALHTVETVKKGDTVIVSGKLKQNEYVDKEGVTKVSYEVQADYVGAELRRTPYSKADTNATWNPRAASGSTDNTIWGKSF